jgi:hypothetical protein
LKGNIILRPRRRRFHFLGRVQTKHCCSVLWGVWPGCVV